MLCTVLPEETALVCRDFDHVVCHTSDHVSVVIDIMVQQESCNWSYMPRMSASLQARGCFDGPYEG